jgi:hypothetical protein
MRILQYGIRRRRRADWALPYATYTVSGVELQTAAFEYELALMPRGRFTFRRWRFELWHGAVLRAAGWRTTPRAAERALHNAAAQWSHVALGLRPAEPERVRALDRFALGATLRVDSGEVACVLAPRGMGERPS